MFGNIRKTELLTVLPAAVTSLQVHRGTWARRSRLPESSTTVNITVTLLWKSSMWFLDCEAVGEASPSHTHTHTRRRGPAPDWTVGTNSAGPALGAGDSTEQISRVNKAGAGVGNVFSPGRLDWAVFLFKRLQTGSEALFFPLSSSLGVFRPACDARQPV